MSAFTYRPDGAALTKVVTEAWASLDCEDHEVCFAQSAVAALVPHLLRRVGEQILADIDADIRSGKVRDNGWIQGVKQTAEDLIRTSRKEEP